jgi:hypothetical protein
LELHNFNCAANVISYEIEEDDVCNMHGGDEEFILNFGCKPQENGLVSKSIAVEGLV